ncbi:MAG: hypothetical protein Kow0075_14780 [Salibacteraceae bacterium]
MAVVDAVAANYYTVSSGNYNSAAVWTTQAPNPIPNGDTVFINHTVSLTAQLRVRGVLYIGPNGKVTGNFKINNDDVAGAIINYGEINITQEVHVDGKWFNYNYAYAKKVHNDGYICNTDTIEIDPSQEFDQHGGELDCGGRILFCKMKVHDGVQGTSKFTYQNLDKCTPACPTRYINYQDPAYINPDSSYFCDTNSNGGVLPVELIALSASFVNEDAVEVNWITASEINNDFFVLERSYDLNEWEVVSYVAGAGNSLRTIAYSYTDYGVKQSRVYYQLSQVDFDGTETQFQVIVANRESTASDVEVLTVRPTMASSLISVEGVPTEFAEVRL